MTSFSRTAGSLRAARGSARNATTTTSTDGHERLWLPVGIVLAAVVALAGWMLLVSPVRDDAAALQDQATTATTRADALQAQLRTLQGQQADLPQYQAELQAAQAALPNTVALPTFLRTLQDLGTASGASVTAMTATPPDLATGAQGNGAGSNGAGSNGAASVGAAGVGNVYRVPITLTATGGYDALTGFVAALQTQQPRAVLVTSVNESAAAAELTLTISLVAFVAPTAGATGTGG